MAQTHGSSVLEETTVFDADVHISNGLSAEVVAEYLDEPHRSRVLSPGTFPKSSGADWDPYMGGKIESRPIEGPETIVDALCDEFGIDYPILNAPLATSRLPDTDLAIALMRASNDAFIDTFLDPSDFYGLMTVSPQAPEQAAEEIDRLGDESQIVGVFVSTLAQYTPLGDPSYDVMYQAAQENDLPIVYHGTAGGGFRYDFPIQNRGLESFLEVHTLAHHWQQTLTFTSLLVQGVPEKFPDLDFVFLENGLSWVPHMMWRLNKESSIRRNEAPLLQKSPEAYVRDQFYFASQPLGEPDDPTHMQQMVDIVGPESIIFASDYPHWDFDHPVELDKHLDETFTPEEREQILTRNPATVFGIDP